MTIDFFVHPEFDGKAFKWKGEVKKEYPDYLLHLKKILDRSRFPVLIREEGGDLFFKENIPLENQFISNTPSCGHVSPDDWERFTILLKGNKSKNMRVHGSYYGLCVDGFAVQLFAHISKGEHWFIKSEKDKEEVIKMVEEHRLNKDFSSSRIKYGVVLYPNLSIQPKLDGIDKLPLFGVTLQFTDHKTIIYGSPKNL